MKKGLKKSFMMLILLLLLIMIFSYLGYGLSYILILSILIFLGLPALYNSIIKKKQGTSRLRSHTSETDNIKRRAELELALGINRLTIELGEACLENDHTKSAHKIHNIAKETKDILNFHKKYINEGSVPLSMDARLKIAKSLIQDAETDLQDAMNKGLIISHSIQQMLQDAQKEVDAGHFAAAKEYAQKCSENINIAVKDYERQKAEQTRKQRELEQLRSDIAPGFELLFVVEEQIQKEEDRTAFNNIDQEAKPKDLIEKLIGENMSEDLLKEIISKLDKIIEELKESRQSAEVDANRIIDHISDIERALDR